MSGSGRGKSGSMQSRHHSRKYRSKSSMSYQDSGGCLLIMVAVLLGTLFAVIV